LVYLSDFNFQFDRLPNIKYLEVSCNDQYLIDNLPNSLEELVLTRGFNLELNDLPNQLKKIRLQNVMYDKKLNNLPESVEIIELSSRYYEKISKLPKNLKTIKCNSRYRFINDFVGYQVQKIYD
jgi:hypothetical protein